jgi:hypothetical protein
VVIKGTANVLAPLTDTKIEAGIAADLQARGLDPSNPEHRARLEAEVDATMAEVMRSYNLDPSDERDRYVMLRLVELGIVPMPGEGPALH